MNKDVLERALKTFWQAALASLLFALPEIIELIPNGWEAIQPALISVGVGALAAGCSALYNGVFAPMLKPSDPIEPSEPSESESE